MPHVPLSGSYALVATLLITCLSAAMGFVGGPWSPVKKTHHGAISTSQLIHNHQLAGWRMASKVKINMRLTIPANEIKIEWSKPDAAGGFGAVYFAQTVRGEIKLGVLKSWRRMLLIGRHSSPPKSMMA